MTDISKLSNAKLADHIEAVVARRDAAMDVIYSHALSSDERWMDIVERLGDVPCDGVSTALEYRATDPRHPDLIAYRVVDEDYENAYAEARRRCGPVNARGLYSTILRQMGRRRAA